jgi:hypothetical protein
VVVEAAAVVVVVVAVVAAVEVAVVEAAEGAVVVEAEAEGVVVVETEAVAVVAPVEHRFRPLRRRLRLLLEVLPGHPTTTHGREASPCGRSPLREGVFVLSTTLRPCSQAHPPLP